MFKTALIAAAMASLMGFAAPPEFQADFESSKACHDFEGRKLWQGQQGYYLQAYEFYTGQSGLLSQDAVTAILYSENTEDALSPYAKACA